MTSNFEKHKEDFDKMIIEGKKLLKDLTEHHKEMRSWCYYMKNQYPNALTSEWINYDSENIFSEIIMSYTTWYTKVLGLLKQISPDYVEGFLETHKKILECLKNTANVVYKMKGEFASQLGTVIGTKESFESSLWRIRQLVQADFFDTELDQAEELNKNGFIGAAGVIAGVALERHLFYVCEGRGFKTKAKRNISELAQCLENNGVIDIPTLRKLVHLASIRNDCCHSSKQVTEERVQELIEGVKTVIKTVF